MNKLPLSVFALFVAMWSNVQAFSLDAVGYEGGDLARFPDSMLVPGYGELVFETRSGAPLVIDPAYRCGGNFNPESRRHDAWCSVIIEFTGAEEGDVASAVAQEVGDRPASVWGSIPEPAPAGLGMLGVLMLLLGRWR